MSFPPQEFYIFILSAVNTFYWWRRKSGFQSKWRRYNFYSITRLGEGPNRFLLATKKWTQKGHNIHSVPVTATDSRRTFPFPCPNPRHVVKRFIAPFHGFTDPSLLSPPPLPPKPLQSPSSIHPPPSPLSVPVHSTTTLLFFASLLPCLSGIIEELRDSNLLRP